jgi:acyl-CoA reductase-like NAD-dependent aldehyde dehydrogenase
MGKALAKASTLAISENGLEKTSSRRRVEVLKTYKIYIGGQFPRTESGRYYIAANSRGEQLANICLSSRKDFRDAVVAARNAFKSWSGRAAFNRGQILYRMAEMLEARKAQFIEELMKQDASKTHAQKEVTISIDRLIYYAGWCDKYQQLFGTVNPVASSHFNFSVPEPTGVVAVVAPQDNSLVGLVSTIAPTIAGGNTCVILASETKPLCAVSFSEVINSSDVPGGVINILTGKPTELYSHFASHMDVNAVVYCGSDSTIQKELQQKGAGNVKRVLIYQDVNWPDEKGQSPYYILDTQEIKTTWHPIERVGGGGGGY